MMNLKMTPVLGLTLLSLAANAQDDVEQRITDLIGKMTIEEKALMIRATSSFTSGGVERLGIPELVMSDGPHGVRPEHGRDWELDNDPAVNDRGTYLPTGIALAATWNTELGYEFGKVLGREANARGKDVILGPGVNIMRTPLNGRNFEYLSEDPYLTSRMAVGYIKGVQEQGISACVKHYVANNQETDRTTVDVNMSERALREIYLPAFKAAVVEANVNTMMGAYNKFRGQWATHNHYLVNQILKQEWGFEGVLISDWGAVHNTLEALYNGTDIEMGTDLAQLPNPNYPAFFLGDTVIALVSKGLVDESVIDEKVRRILRVMIKTHMLDGGRPAGAFATKEHQQFAKKVADEAIVLLKNEGNMLPLDAGKSKTIAVIGANAVRENALGGGSSQVRAAYEITPLQGLKNAAGKRVNFKHAAGYTIARDAKAEPTLIAEAVKLASSADEVIFVGGWTHGFDYAIWDDNAYDAEAFDKPDMQLPFGQSELIAAVLKANPKTVVVMLGGGAMDVSTWLAEAPVLLQAWYPGMEGGNAIGDIVFGKVNPSGKLPVTFPKKLEDSPAHRHGTMPGDNAVDYYTEDIYVGYRYFDTFQVMPEFAFGHGLSYTTFEYSNLKLSAGANSTATVTLNVKNTGKIAGAEVIQVYVGDPVSAVKRPKKELKGFQKVFLQAGESKEITVELPAEAFKYFSESEMDWVLEGGAFTVKVGSAADDIRLEGSVEVK